MSKTVNGNGTYTTYIYDADSEILAVVNSAPGGAVNSSFVYTYNNVGLCTTEITIDGAWTYTYDAAGQLTQAVFTPNSADPDGLTAQNLQYFYDAAGNRGETIINGVPTNYTVNDRNEYTQVGNTTYQYDANGNLISETTGGVTTTFTYNANNQLIGISTPGQSSTIYQYNAFGNMYQSTQGGVQTEYLYDPMMSNLIDQFTSNGATVAQYAYGLGLVRQLSESGTYYYSFDALGSTTNITNSTGNEVSAYCYLPFGLLLSSNVNVPNPFEFVGQWGVDTVSAGLAMMSTRLYDVTLGRFFSTDPIGLAGGSVNYYEYAQNNPVSLVDPSGFDAKQPSSILEWKNALADANLQIDQAIYAYQDARRHYQEAGDDATAAEAEGQMAEAQAQLTGALEKYNSLYNAYAKYLEENPNLQNAADDSAAAEDQALNHLLEIFSASFDTSTLRVADSPYSIRFSYAGDADFGSATGTSVLTVTPATPVITWSNPADITYGTALGAAQLGATANTAGSFSYTLADGVTPATGAVPNAGQGQLLNLTFTPSDTADYSTATAQAAINVDPATLTITPHAGQSMIYGAAVPTLTYGASGFVNGDSASVLTGLLGTPATSAGPVGNYLFMLGSLSAAPNYTLVLAGNAPSFAVTPATLTISPNAAQSMSYGSIVPTLTYGANGYVNGDGLSVITGLLGTTATSASPVGAYAFTLGSLSAANYTLLLDNSIPTFAVTPATLTITPTAGLSMIYRAAVPALTYSASGLVNGETFSILTGQLTTTATSTSSVGGYPISLGSLTANSNYSLALANNSPSFTVTPRPLTVTGISAANRVYNGATSATLSGVSGAKLSGVLSGDTVTLNTSGERGSFATKNAGTSITVAISGLTLGGAQAADYSLTATTTANIAPEPLTVTAVANTKTYDGSTSAAAIPAISSGKLQGTDTGTFSEIYAAKNVGTSLTLIPSGAINDGAGGKDYTVTFKSAAIGTIKARPITVTAGANTKTYDGTTGATAIPTITSGTLVTGDIAKFAESYATKNAGSGLRLTPAGSVSDGDGGRNYAVTFVSIMTGSIAPRTLTVTANSASKVYGQANPALKPIYTGFATGDSARVLTGAPSLTTMAKTSSGVGSYPITVGAGTLKDANYTFVFVPGVLTITPATLTVTATSVSRAFGAANAVFTDTITGFVNGDKASVVQGAASLVTTATAASNVGAYSITVSVGTLSAANYTFRFVNGALTVTKATLTIAANNVTWTIGQPEPPLPFTIAGLVDGNTTTPILSTTATGTSPTGRYTISLKSMDAIAVKTLLPTATVDEFTVTLVSPDTVLANYRVFFISAVLTRLA